MDVPLDPNRVAGQLEKDVLERRKFRTEVDDAHVVFRQAMNHVCDEIDFRVRESSASIRRRSPTARCGSPRKRSSAAGFGCYDDDRPLGTVSAHELRRRADIDDAAMVDDRDPVAKSLGFLHQARGQKDGLAALPDTADQIPDRASRLRIKAVVSSSRNTTSGSLMSARAMKSRCFWPPDSVMNHAFRSVAQPELLDRDDRGIERCR